MKYVSTKSLAINNNDLNVQLCKAAYVFNCAKTEDYLFSFEERFIYLQMINCIEEDSKLYSLDNFTLLALKHNYMHWTLCSIFINTLNKESNRTNVNYYYLLRVIHLIVKPENSTYSFERLNKFYKDEQLYRKAYKANASVTNTMTGLEVFTYLSNSRIAKVMRTFLSLYNISKLKSDEIYYEYNAK